MYDQLGGIEFGTKTGNEATSIDYIMHGNGPGKQPGNTDWK